LLVLFVIEGGFKWTTIGETAWGEGSNRLVESVTVSDSTREKNDYLLDK
jgi:hypothetical protein